MRNDEAAAEETAPSGARTVWVPFSFLAVWGYVLYGLGNAVPYLRADLQLTEFQAGLHSSALAIGVLAAGIGVDSLVRRIGSRWLPDVAVALLVTGLGLIVFAPGLPVSLTGALMLGLGGGTLGIDVNVRLGRAGGSETRRLLGQANALAMVAAAAAPLAMGLAASGLHAWRVALLLPMVAYLGLAAIRPREPEVRSTVLAPTSTLPGSYWLAWLMLLLSVSIEFSFVYWGSTVVGKRTGISSAEATLLASLFVAGMFVARAAIGRGLGAGRASPRLLATGLCVAMVGATVVWVSTVPALSGIGLFIGGLGIAGLWPIGLSAALQTAPNARLKAAARATLASGGAALVAPSALGLVADNVGVVGAWPIVLILAACALLVLAVTSRVR